MGFRKNGISGYDLIEGRFVNVVVSFSSMLFLRLIFYVIFIKSIRKQITFNLKLDENWFGRRYYSWLWDMLKSSRFVRFFIKEMHPPRVSFAGLCKVLILFWERFKILNELGNSGNSFIKLNCKSNFCRL